MESSIYNYNTNSAMGSASTKSSKVDSLFAPFSHPSVIDFPQPVRCLVRCDFLFSNYCLTHVPDILPIIMVSYLLHSGLRNDPGIAQILIHRPFIPTPGKQSISNVGVTDLASCRHSVRLLRQTSRHLPSAQMQRGRVDMS
jgi:hypothetical protein